MKSVSEVDIILKSHSLRLATEYCDISSSVGRVLQDSIVADRDLPPYDRVMMDGIAISEMALDKLNNTPLKLEGEVLAGQSRQTLKDLLKGALLVMTGAVLPEGADIIIPKESLRFQDDLVWVETVNNLSDQYIHRRGSDSSKGDVLISPSGRITPTEVTALASVGIRKVKVSSKPKIAVVTTGDELVDIEDLVQEHQIRRSNGYTIAAALKEYGYDSRSFHVFDDKNLLFDSLKDILNDYDILITTGAVSKGSVDYLPEVFKSLGLVCFLHGVAQRPGKPFWCGSTSSGKYVFALPGNPVSVMVCLYRYLLPFLERSLGIARKEILKARITKTISSVRPLTMFLPVVFNFNNGELMVTPQGAKNSGDFLSLIGTDGFLELEPGENVIEANTLVSVYPWHFLKISSY